MVTRRYAPERGDLVWLQCSPQAGHEQGGRRPALILSPLAYNRAAGLALACPITSQAKGYPFEVTLSTGLPIAGVVLADHVRSVDWQARRASFIASAAADLIASVRARLHALL